MTCINCGSECVAYCTKKTFLIDRCPGCRLMAVRNVPEYLSPYYSAGYFTGDTALEGYMNYDVDKAVSKETYVAYFDLLAKFLPAKTRSSLFEVGCATGFFLALAEERGWIVAGIDISEYAVEQAQTKGLSATVGTLESWQPSKTYDCVSMQDVIEHVKDPVDTICRAHAALNTGGTLLITTPDAGSLWARLWGKHWHAFVPPQHLFYFSQKNLSALLSVNGFDVVYAAHHGKKFSPPYIFRLLNSWTGWPVFARLANWSAKTWLKKIAVPINVGDNLLLLAKKTPL